MQPSAPLRIRWSSHLRYMREHWHPGQHVSIITPTGGGKSHLAVRGLLTLPALRHSRILLIDDKHTDETTREFGLPVAKWPDEYYPRAENRLDCIMHGKKLCPDPEHYRLLVPSWSWRERGEASIAKAQTTVLDALERSYKSAVPGDGWVIVLDETRTLADTRPPSLNLGPALKYIWRMGRYRHVTLIALTQIPLGVPGELYDQATYLYFGRDPDDKRIERFAELGGSLPRKLMRDTIPTLGDHEFLFLGNRGKMAAIIEVGRET